MEHRGIQYQVEQMTDATCFIWTVHLDEKARIGVSLTKENAISNAVRAIDKAAVGLQSKKCP
jgi:hypothetical protein